MTLFENLIEKFYSKGILYKGYSFIELSPLAKNKLYKIELKIMSYFNEEFIGKIIELHLTITYDNKGRRPKILSI